MNSPIKTLYELTPGIFGENDCLFALHPCDKERAIAFLNYAFFNSISLEKVIACCKEYLANRGCSIDYIKKETRRIHQWKLNPYNKKSCSSCWLITKEKSINIENFDGDQTRNATEVIDFINIRTSDEHIIKRIHPHVRGELNLQQKLAFQNRKNQKPISVKYYNEIFADLIIGEHRECYIVARPVKNLKLQGQGVIFYENTLNSLKKIKEIHPEYFQ